MQALMMMGQGFVDRKKGLMNYTVSAGNTRFKAVVVLQCYCSRLYIVLAVQTFTEEEILTCLVKM